MKKLKGKMKRKERGRANTLKEGKREKRKVRKDLSVMQEKE